MKGVMKAFNAMEVMVERLMVGEGAEVPDVDSKLDAWEKWFVRVERRESKVFGVEEQMEVLKDVLLTIEKARVVVG